MADLACFHESSTSHAEKSVIKSLTLVNSTKLALDTNQLDCLGWQNLANASHLDQVEGLCQILRGADGLRMVIMHNSSHHLNECNNAMYILHLIRDLDDVGISGEAGAIFLLYVY